MRLRFLSAALNDLAAIDAFLAERNPAAAARVIGTIERKINLLRDTPQMGPRTHIPNLRRLIVADFPYVVV